MKVDYNKYPMIPKNCQLNYNKVRDVYQVFREFRVFDEQTKKKKTQRQTIGQIKNGTFSYSKLYLERERNKRLEIQLEEQKRIPGHARQTLSKISEVVKETELDERDCQRIIFPIEPIVHAALFSALVGRTDCPQIAQYFNDNRAYFAKCYDNLPDRQLSHDVVYRTFLKINPTKFETFYEKFLSNLMTKQVDGQWIICADGQAVRASTGRRSKDGKRHESYMLMNFFDQNRRICLKQRLIAAKTNEISVGPEMLSCLDITGAIVTADAMSCQVRFVDAVLARGANYCLSLKGNQEKSWNEVKAVFSLTHPDQILKYEDQVNLSHGRIETRTYSMIRGSLLSKMLRNKWNGLEQGCVIRVHSTREIKVNNNRSEEDRYYFSSMPYAQTSIEQMADIIKSHWSIENNLHWVLDICFIQDRIQAKDEAYLTNRVGLNKLALAMLENYRVWLWDTNRVKGDIPSIKSVLQRCAVPEYAMECIACSQGFL